MKKEEKPTREKIQEAILRDLQRKLGTLVEKSLLCADESMKKKLTSSKTASDPNSRINKSLRLWNC